MAEQIIARLLEIDRQPDRIVCRLVLDRDPLSPVAPAGLYRLPAGGDEAFQLHKLASRSPAVLGFETYEWQEPLPAIGEAYAFRSWWTRAAFDAVCDTRKRWELATYPDNGDHDHCLLTWETIAAYGPYHRLGYRSGDDWVTIQAYDTFFQRDLLRLRQRARAQESG